MGRHDPSRHRHRGPARSFPTVVVLLAVGAVAAAGVVWVTTRPAEQDATPAAGGCPITAAVQVTAAPEVSAVVRDVLSGPIPGGEDGCVVAEVTSQEPLQTLAGLSAGAGSRPPQIWIPDDVSWAERAGTAVTGTRGALARTSLVLATSQTVADAAGWLTDPPTWSEALTAPAGIALADPAVEVEGLLAAAAAQATSADQATADDAVVQAVVQAGRSVDTAAALAAAIAGAADAPVAAVTERQVRDATADGVGQLVLIAPAGGSPQLTPTVLRTVNGDGAAVDAVLERLAAAAADGSAVRAAGWRDAQGQGADGSSAPPLLQPPDGDLAALTARVAALAAPSRLLTVVDVSASMDADTGDGTRAELARDALTTALAVLPDRTVGSLWVFAAQLQGDQDWRELLPPRPLATPVGEGDQRRALAEQFAAIPDLLVGGGTGLYDTTLAAVRAAREGFDPGAVSIVVLITDGTDDDPAGIGERQLLDTLTAEADPARPVQIIAVGIGPDTDSTVLDRIAEATGGRAYTALRAADLTTVLFDALRSR